jgi:hypothetical protein
LNFSKPNVFNSVEKSNLYRLGTLNYLWYCPTLVLGTLIPLLMLWPSDSFSDIGFDWFSTPLYYMYLCDIWYIVLHIPLWYLVHCIICTSVIFGPLYYMFLCDIWSIVLHVPLWYLVHCITCTSMIFGPLYYMYFCDILSTRSFVSDIEEEKSTISIVLPIINW